MDIGKVISTPDGPSPSFFAFAIAKGKKISKDQFVRVSTEEGTMVAMVENIIKTNRYYANPETVVEADNLEQLFHVDEWEFLIAEAMPLGVISGGQVLRPTVPPSPGDMVQTIEGEVLSKFLGFRERGIHIGQVLHHSVPVRLSLTKTFQKHLAILAMSGSGKSYLTSVLVEELLKRKKEDGRVAVVIFDTHGEYTGFAEKPPAGVKDFSGSAVNVVDIRIPVPRLTAREISAFTSLSAVQVAELDKVIRELEGQLYDFRELAEEVLARKMADKTKKALYRWLMELHSQRIFARQEDIITRNEGEKEEHHLLKELVRPGRLVVFDLSNYLSTRVRDLIVLWVTKELFGMRRRGEVAPLTIFLEEAHNFIPEGEQEVPTKWMFETIAREGRKFLCSLVVISQRPIKLSTTVLSQCNTHIIMRVTNPYDLKHIGESSEGITQKTLKSLTSLQVGEALVVGEAVRYPVFIKVRQRESWEKKFSDLEEEARRYEESMDAEKAEGVEEAFL